MLEDVDLSGIQDERARQCIVRLLNLVEEVTAALRSAQEENQRLRDEIARLKGEQGKPTIKGNTPPPPALPPDYSSERQRRVPKERSKSPKVETLRIDREQVLAVDPTLLPEDAEFKGHEDVVVQDLVVGTDNVLFHKEKYYSPSAGKSFLASLPRGYDGPVRAGDQGVGAGAGLRGQRERTEAPGVVPRHGGGDFRRAGVPSADPGPGALPR